NFFNKKKQTINFSLLMGASFGSLIPHVFFSNANYAYMYDAWPRFHDDIVKKAKRMNIKMIFFSSHQVTKLFNKLNSGIKGVWVPEGIKVEDYSYVPFNLKDIDVLEFGRKYDVYHDKIAPVLKANNYLHLFEKQRGDVVFKSRFDFLNGLAKSKISICIPSNITHPERAEGISCMTLRYLQSMSSKCLIVGILPDEMKYLFDYQPIIEIDIENAASQILDILANYESYFPLIERNYAEIQKFHTWDIRLEEILLNIKNEER
uniref:glycosyltransferase n=1 Tax=Flavobacterium sp. TaxID=239 RepID=UPI002614DD2D